MPLPIASRSSEAKQDELDQLLPEHADNVDTWDAQDYAIRWQIISTIPHMIFIQIQSQDMAAEMWDALKCDFEGHTQDIQNELRN